MENRSSLSDRRFPRIRMAGDFTVKAGWTLDKRQLYEYELVYFPAGTQTRYTVEDKYYILDEPCFILTRPLEPHMYQFDSLQPTRHLFIHFDIDLPAADRPACSILSPGSASLIPSAQISILPGLLKQIIHLASAKPIRWMERGALLLYTLLTELDAAASDIGSMESPPPSQISKALQYIDHHLTRSLSVAEIARDSGWTHEHFTRVFVQAVGVSPQSFIARRRIEKASQLLIQTNSSIKEIAYAVGFRDEHYFSRCFSKIKGRSASDYRNQFSDPRAQHLAPAEAYTAAYPMNRYFIYSRE
ncbi:helix-turn-helix domain-containing protein [Paenibacillus piri]|uniref:helix-turn-helix domain-containing protein n=1 Tax=Paenibacillus piri TaxID=2547395 RepID=UPI0014048F90|nr:AraC family transcriptional regulator [Paenibacillus piri]